MIKILIADDHAILADGLESILNAQHDMEVVGKSATGKGIFEILAHTDVHLILLDMNLLDNDRYRSK